MKSKSGDFELFFTCGFVGKRENGWKNTHFLQGRSFLKIGRIAVLHELDSDFAQIRYTDSTSRYSSCQIECEGVVFIH